MTDVSEIDDIPTQGGEGEEKKPVLLVNKKEKYRSLKVRTTSAVIMIGGFLTIVYLGHIPLMMMNIIAQFFMVKELFAIARQKEVDEDRNLPGFRLQQWYFFGVALFYHVLHFVKGNLLREVASTANLARFFGWLLRRHKFITVTFYFAGVVMFVLSLKSGLYRYQFKQFAWTHLALACVIVPCNMLLNAIFEGIIWYLLPLMIVIVNDIMAYLAGFFFGRTPLIKLSPKKTWEGFIGGAIGTMVFAYWGADIFSRFKFMTCSPEDLSFIWKPCEVPPLYLQNEYTLETFISTMASITMLPDSLATLLIRGLELLPGPTGDAVRAFTFLARPMQMHAICLGIFASLVAPFGGFFASGFKRAIGVKDFGNSIPGHGGIMDRLDCQIFMSIFCYSYRNQYVTLNHAVSLGGVIASALQLEGAQQVELLARLAGVLEGSKHMREAQIVEVVRAAGMGHVLAPGVA